LKTLLLSLLLASALLGAAADEAQLNLPRGAKAAWAVPEGAALPAGARFDVDAKGGVWLLPVSRVLTRADGVGLVLEQEMRDLAFDGGELRLASDLAAGGLRLTDVKGKVSGKVKPLLLAPGPGWRLAEGGTDGVVAFGWDEDAGRSALVRLNDRRKVLQWPERVLAAVAGGGAWYLATPSGVQRVSREGKAQPWGAVPGGISSLAWVEGAGLAAGGPQGVSLFTAAGKRRPLVSAKAPRVRGKSGALYVLLPSQGGVLKITGLSADAQ
jgi:hypothetical protein